MSAAMFGAQAIRRAYLVDDDPAYRRSMELLLVSEFWSVDCFATASEFADQAPLLEPGILLLDLHLKGASGLDLLERHPAILDRFTVVMITGAGEIETAVRSMKAGAVDFIEKPMAATDLLDRLESIAMDFTLSLQERRRVFDARRQIEMLSPRERDVLERLLNGAPNKVIARDLSISPRTVEMHRARMVQKLGVDTTAAALEIGRKARGS